MPKKRRPRSGPGTYGPAWGTRGVPGVDRAQGVRMGGKYGRDRFGRLIEEDGSVDVIGEALRAKRKRRP